MRNVGPYLYCASPLSCMSQCTYQTHTVLLLLVQGEKLITWVLDILKSHYWTSLNNSKSSSRSVKLIIRFRLF
jgi:hypothetical protein